MRFGPRGDIEVEVHPGRKLTAHASHQNEGAAFVDHVAL